MPMQKPKRSGTVHHKKRRGQHHAHSKNYLKVYWPYVPMTLIVAMGLIVGNWRPQTTHGVLAYATEMSVTTLLSATNGQRAANGVANLSINSKLNSAAQSKANDMTSRDYWSHNTPEGNAPWTFMDSAGYDYQKAGENLAYGFASSTDTITGWMNSPGHKANMLDSGFTEVGFGFANSSNFNNSGPETVVVAMYGKPQVESAQTPAPAPTPAPTTPTPTTTTPASKPAPATTTTTATPNTPTPAETTTQPTAEQPTEAKKDVPVNTDAPLNTEPAAVGISRVQTWTRAPLPWLTLAIGLMSGLAIAMVALKHGLALRKLAVEGEEFIIHHPWADITLVGLVMFAYVISQTAGVIK